MGAPHQVLEELAQLNSMIGQDQAPTESEGDPLADPTSAPVEAAPEPPPAPQDGAQPPAPTPAPPTEQAPLSEEEESYKHRYEVLQGKFNKADRELRAENVALSERLDQMQADIAASKPPAPTHERLGITEEEVELIGEDLLNMQERIAQKTTAGVSDKVTAMEAQLAEMKAAAEDTFFTNLDQQVPNWEELQHASGFMTTERSQQLHAAQTAGDAFTAAQLFKAFQSTQAPAAAPPDAPSVESQVMPPPAVPAPTTEPATMTSAEMQLAISEATKLPSLKREAELNRLNKMMQDGLVRG